MKLRFKILWNVKHDWSLPFDRKVQLQGQQCWLDGELHCQFWIVPCRKRSRRDHTGDMQLLLTMLASVTCFHTNIRSVSLRFFKYIYTIHIISKTISLLMKLTIKIMILERLESCTGKQVKYEASTPIMFYLSNSLNLNNLILFAFISSNMYQQNYGFIH